MTVVDVSQLQDRSFLVDQKVHVDNIDPAEINPELRKTPEAAVTERQKSTLRGLWGTYSGRALRRMHRERAQCQCCNLRFQWQQLVRLRSSKNNVRYAGNTNACTP